VGSLGTKRTRGKETIAPCLRGVTRARMHCEENYFPQLTKGFVKKGRAVLMKLTNGGPREEEGKRKKWPAC